MNIKKTEAIIDNLNKIVNMPFSFCGVTIELHAVIRAKHSKKWVVATHHHPWYEFNFVSKGSCFTTINGKEFLVAENTAYCIRPSVSHSHRHNNTGDDGLCIRFSMSNDKNSRQSKHMIECLSAPLKENFSVIMDELASPCGFLSLQAKFAAFIMNIFEKETQPFLPPEKKESDIVSPVIIYLSEYYTRKIEVNDLAAAMNMSYRNLARRFKKDRGITIFDELTKIRLAAAKNLLTSTDMAMHDIAHRCGYANEYYFSKIFKKTEKISPSLYRKQYSCSTARHQTLDFPCPGACP